jgi:hypothetical protein
VRLLFRSTALAVALSLAGLSSTLIVCVTSCTEERSASAHGVSSCHDEAAAATRMVPPDLDCRHQPARRAEDGELIRHSRAAAVPGVLPATVHLMPGLASHVMWHPPTESLPPPARIQPRVLRI